MRSVPDDKSVRVSASGRSGTVISSDGPSPSVKAVSDRFENPFGLNPPCSIGRPVPGYGDPNADFHLIGDHPGHHGGEGTGVPFTGTKSAARLQGALAAVGLLTEPHPTEPLVSNLFMNYLYMCPVADQYEPTQADYDDLERFFDAELRAVNAHILMPVGQRASDHVLRDYSTRFHKEPRSMGQRHAREVRGRGFLIIPIADPLDWDEGDRDRLVETLERILASDYRQTKGVATVVG